MKPYSIAFFLFVISSSAVAQEISVESYLEKHSLSPVEYVISRFKSYDCVFLGEMHRIKHDVEFVSQLIPELYKNGIRNLTYEFGVYTDQSKLDSLLTAEEWNSLLIYELLYHGAGINWGYKEYLDILKAAWSLNQTIPEDKPKFRIIFLGYEFHPCKKGYERFGGIDPDLSMANTLDREVLAKKEKVLVYCGMHHSFTRYKQPMYDFTSKTNYGFNGNRMGNIIYDKYPDRTFTIMLHSPWISGSGLNDSLVKPVNGYLDSIIKVADNKPMGFDVLGTPAGQLRSTDSYYAIGYDDFKLEDFCDGYIIFRPFHLYRGVGIQPDFYTENNLNQVREFLGCMGMSMHTPVNLTTFRRTKLTTLKLVL